MRMRKRFDFSSKRTGKFKKSPHNNAHFMHFPKMVREVIRTSDIVLEVLDARFIDETRNIGVEKDILSQGKKLIFVLNKADLVDFRDLKLNYDLSSIEPYVLFSCKSRIGRQRLRSKIKIEVAKLKMGDEKARVGIIGYPNTGKSSLINVLVARKGAATSAQAGFTKSMQKIRFNKDILILDTPGVFIESEKPELSTTDLKKHATVGIKNPNKIKEAALVVGEIMKQNVGLLSKYYGVEEGEDTDVFLENLATKRKLMKKGGVFDLERAARLVIQDWQEGRIK